MFTLKRTVRVEPAWIQKWSSELQHTPDMLQLERRLHHRLFVPDEMMLHNREHNRLGGLAVKINLGFITEEKFSFLKRIEQEKVIGIPLRETAISNIPQAPIRGEMYAVPSKAIEELDKYRQNGVQFQRQRVILRPYSMQKKDWDREVQHAEHKIPAWMYVGIADYWQSELSTGITIKHFRAGELSISRISRSGIFSSINIFKPNNKLLEPYHYFSPLEYDTLNFRPNSRPSTMPGLWKLRRSG